MDRVVLGDAEQIKIESIAGKLKYKLGRSVKKIFQGTEVNVWVMKCTQQVLTETIEQIFRDHSISAPRDKKQSLKKVAFQFPGSDDVFYWNESGMQHIYASKIGIKGLIKLLNGWFTTRVDQHSPTGSLSMPVGQLIQFNEIMTKKLAGFGLKLSDLQLGRSFEIIAGNLIMECVVDENGYLVLLNKCGDFVQFTQFRGFDFRGCLQKVDGEKVTEPVTKMIKGRSTL